MSVRYESSSVNFCEQSNDEAAQVQDVDVVVCALFVSSALCSEH